MIIGIGILVFMAICALALVGLGESHSRVSRILNEMADDRVREDSDGEADTAFVAQAPQSAVPPEPFSEAGFTRSLLALSKVGSRVPGDCPALEHGEFSSLASVRQAQSRTHDPLF
jgi:hypothetical protein